MELQAEHAPAHPLHLWCAGLEGRFGAAYVLRVEEKRFDEHGDQAIALEQQRLVGE